MYIYVRELIIKMETGKLKYFKSFQNKTHKTLNKTTLQMH